MDYSVTIDSCPSDNNDLYKGTLFYLTAMAKAWAIKKEVYQTGTIESTRKAKS